MNNKNGALLIITACLGCAIIIFCGGYCAFFSGDTLLNSSISTAPSHTQSTGNAVLNQASSKVSSQNNSSASGSAVTVTTQGAVLGAIKSQFFSPYSAKYKYNNVYLKNNTPLDIDIKKYLLAQTTVNISKNSTPQVLLVHTHTTESYMLNDNDYYTDTDAAHTKNEEHNMVRIGNIFEEKLKAANIGVIHCHTVHDYPSYNGSYEASKQTILKMLEENPSIQVVIDIHRDAISDGNGGKIKPVAEIGGKSAAQVMLVMGSQSGSVTLYPEWEKNLSLAVKYQQTMEVMYPGLARPLALYSKKYNEYLHTGSMLIEVGTDANTLNEAVYGAELAANALVCLLNTLI